MRSRVILEDGSRIALSRLRRLVPHHTFMTPTHLEVCERLAARRDVDADLRPVYVNLLFKKSDRAKNLTALISLIEAGRLRVQAVRADFFAAEFADLLGEKVRIEGSPRQRRSVINARQVARFAVKTLAHLVYRRLRTRRLPRPHVLRAWVDTTDSVYPREVEEATLLIYPFTGNALRQVRYVRHCARSGRHFSLMGLPYRWSDPLGVLLGSGQRDRRLVGAEAGAARRHARELRALGVERVSTTDEFEAGSYELHRLLMQDGATCRNTSHGVSVYGPYVHYDHFRFYNEQQLAFYRRRGHFESYDYRSLPGPIGEAAGAVDAPFEPMAVYVQGNWQQSGRFYERRFEEDAIARIRDACRAIGMDFAVKLHPNLRTVNAMWLRARFGVALLRRLEEIGGRKPVFLNMLSTTYYSSLRDGPTVFVADDLLEPWRIFGEGIPCVRLDELEAELARFEEPAYYAERLGAQIAREKGRAAPEADRGAGAC